MSEEFQPSEEWTGHRPILRTGKFFGQLGTIHCFKSRNTSPTAEIPTDYANYCRNNNAILKNSFESNIIGMSEEFQPSEEWTCHRPILRTGQFFGQLVTIHYFQSRNTFPR